MANFNLNIDVPQTDATPELLYVINWVFREVLAINIALQTSPLAHEVRISGGGKTLRLNTSFFCYSREKWRTGNLAEPNLSQTLKTESPSLCPSAIHPPLPVFFGDPMVRQKGQIIDCSADLLGCIFFLISRIEETKASILDEHARYTSGTSTLGRLGLLNRPIADECIALIRHWLQLLWPDLAIKHTNGQTKVSCDVDRPLNYWARDYKHAWRKPLGELIKQRAPQKAVASMQNIFAHWSGKLDLDTYNTFDWIMDVNEACDNQVEFFFLAGVTSPDKDGSYQLSDPFIQALMLKIAGRGHLIGLHPSFNTYNDLNALSHERAKLIEALSTLGIKQQLTTTRQHYLRWDSALTPKILNTAGFKIDSTLGFAEHAGFRAGTSRDFPMYDLKARKPLELREHPLIVMDQALLNPQYMNLSAPLALNYASDLKQKCYDHGGNFNILWHNSELQTKTRALYKSLIAR